MPVEGGSGGEKKLVEKGDFIAEIQEERRLSRDRLAVRLSFAQEEEGCGSGGGGGCWGWGGAAGGEPRASLEF